MPSADCLSEEKLLAYQVGDLPVEAADAVARHLEACPRCEALAAHLDEVVDPVVIALRQFPPAAAAQRETPPPARPVVVETPTLLAPTPMATPMSEAPHSLEGYEILDEIGRGGMGVVYRAVQRRLQRTVALKMVLAGAHATPEQLTRFLVEAEMVARLTHPHIVQIHEVGQHNGMPFVALEYVPGGTLANRLHGRPWAVRRAVVLAEQLARAVQHAHQQGVVHRDLKPANVLLTDDETPKIADFGLAKPVQGSGGLTVTGTIMGTPGYMAPEQASRDSRLVGPAADVYALGAILYELLAGRPPFEGDTPLDILQQLQSDEPPSLARLQPQLPRDLVTICHRCLDKEPARRYATAGALADDLHRFLNGEPIQARPVGELERVWKWAKRRPAVAGLLAALVLALTGGTAVSLYYAFKAEERAHTAEARRIEAENRRIEVEEATERYLQAQRAQDAQFARALTEQALALAQQGDSIQGLHRMTAILPRVAGMPDLDRVLRANLAAWGEQPWTLCGIVELPPDPGRHEDSPPGAFSPDGSLLVCPLPTGLQCYTVATGQPRGARLGHRAARWVTFSPDGRHLLSSGSLTGSRDDAVARLWDAETGQPVGPPLGPAGQVVGAIFSPDGRAILTCHADDTIGLWESATGRPCPHQLPKVRHRFVLEPVVADRFGRLLPLPGEPPQFSGDGRFLFARTQNQLQRWQVRTGEPQGTPIAGPIAWFCVSPDDQGLWLSRGRNQVLTHIHLPTYRTERLVIQADRWFASGALSPDSQTLVTQDAKGFVLLREGVTGRPIGELPRHPEHVATAGFFAAGRRLWTTDRARVIRLWEVNPRTWPRAAAVLPQQTHEAPLAGSEAIPPVSQSSWPAGYTQVVYSPDGQTALTCRAHEAPFAQLWDTTTGQPLGQPLRCPCPIVSAVFSPDSRLVATCGGLQVLQAGAAQLWEARTGRLRATLDHPHVLVGLVFSPDNQRLATAGYGSHVWLWDTTTARRVGVLGPLRAIACGLTYSPDGSQLAVHLYNRQRDPAGVRLFDVATGRPGPFLARPSGVHPTGLALVTEGVSAFSPDGKTVLTEHHGDARSQQGLQRWDAVTGRALGAAIPSWRCCLSADGHVLATVDADGSSLRLYDAPTGALRPNGQLLHRGTVVAQALSADGRYLVSASAEGAQLWDVAAALPLGPSVSLGARLIGVGFTPDSHHVLATAADGTTRRWAVPAPTPAAADQFARELQAQTGRCLDGQQVYGYLDAATWAKQWRQGGTAKVRDGEASGVASQAAWHDNSARAAEQAAHLFAARWHLDRLLALQPANAWAHARRAALAVAAGDYRTAETEYAAAVQHSSAAQVADWQRHALLACEATKQAAAARWHCDRLIAAQPGEWQHYLARANAHAQQGQQAESLRDEESALALGVGRLAVLQLAGEHAAAGNWVRTAALYARANAQTPLGPNTLVAHYHEALARVAAADAKGYRQVCQRLLREAGAKPNPVVANTVAMACALGPDAVADWGAPLALMEHARAALAGLALPAEQKSAIEHDFLNTQAAVLYRAGRPEAAIDRLHAALALRPRLGVLHDWLFLALAEHRLGHADKARDWLDKALRNKPKQTADFSWETLEVELLCREAREQLAVPESESRR
jgi:WD40 repeat protein/predicted Zn-dependent protease